MRFPVITVSIAVYKVEAYIRQCLLSVLNQNYPNLEVLVVDDCGGDRSVDIVKETVLSHPRGEIVKIISHPRNIGTGAARNTGLDNAKGDYIFFLDGDDYIESNAITLLYGAIAGTDTQLVMSSHRVVDENGNELSKIGFKSGHYEGRFAIDKWTQAEKRPYPPYLWNKLYRVAFLRENKISATPSHRNEDPWFSYQLMYVVTSFTILPDITLNYVMREGSTIHQQLSDYYYKQYQEMFISMRDQIVLYKDKGVDIPKSYIDYVGVRFLESNTTKVVCSNYDKEKKDNYLNLIRTITTTGISVNDFSSLKHKILFVVLKRGFGATSYNLIIRLFTLLSKLKRFI